MSTVASPLSYRLSSLRIICCEDSTRRFSAPNRVGFPPSRLHSEYRVNLGMRPASLARRTLLSVTLFAWRARSIAITCSLTSPTVSHSGCLKEAAKADSTRSRCVHLSLALCDRSYQNIFQHIIVDEVHERGIDSDFLLLGLKSLLVQRPDLK